MTSKKPQIQLEESPDSSNNVEIEKEVKIEISFKQRVIQNLRSLPGTTLQKGLLEGKTLQVYWYILTHDSASIREIQKALNYSSPGVVTYQISKLLSNGVVSKDEESEKYYIKTEVKTGILGYYIRIGYRMIPRFSLYLGIFIVAFIGYFLLAFNMGDEFITYPSSILLFIILIFGTFVFIFESMKMMKMKPK